MKLRTNVGILLPVSCLPSRHGCGDFSNTAFDFLKWMSKHHYHYWQVLPLNPISSKDHCPYMSSCSLAIDIRYISLDKLVDEGLLKDVPPYREHCDKIDYKGVYDFKIKYLKIAYENYKKLPQNGLKKFKTKNKWVFGYATYEAFMKKNKGLSWNKWPKEDINYFLHHTKPPREHLDYIDFVIFMQYVAYTQWKHILAFAHARNIQVICDLPFYVGFDSSDCWMNHDEFHLDPKNNPAFVSGVPPDYFNADGQVWNSPTYNFEKMKVNNYKFLIDRILGLMNLCDILRIDHFRAFDTFFMIPGGETTARNGHWEQGPSYDFFDELYRRKPDIRLIVEDLGDGLENAYKLRDHYNLPGMYIGQFEMMNWESISKPNQVVYTGTHDNQTFYGFFKSLSDQDKFMLNQKLLFPKNLYRACFEYVWNLPAYITIFPLQDLLKLDDRARLNWPGTEGDPNFCFKFKDFACLKKIRFGNK